MCNVLVGVLERRDQVQIDNLPRMADFAIWTRAAETTLGWETGTILELFNTNQSLAQRTVADASVLTAHLEAFLAEQPGETWAGTASMLLFRLEVTLSDDERHALHRARSGWPRDGTRLSNALRRLAPTLRVTHRIDIQLRERSAQARLITLTRIRDTTSLEFPCIPASSASQRHRRPKNKIKTPLPSVTLNDADDAETARDELFEGPPGAKNASKRAVDASETHKIGPKTRFDDAEKREIGPKTRFDDAAQRHSVTPVGGPAEFKIGPDDADDANDAGMQSNSKWAPSPQVATHLPKDLPHIPASSASRRAAADAEEKELVELLFGAKNDAPEGGSEPRLTSTNPEVSHENGPAPGSSELKEADFQADGSLGSLPEPERATEHDADAAVGTIQQLRARYEAMLEDPDPQRRDLAVVSLAELQAAEAERERERRRAQAPKPKKRSPRVKDTEERYEDFPE